MPPLSILTPDDLQYTVFRFFVAWKVCCMTGREERMAELLLLVKTLGLSDISPVVLSDSTNLIVHLATHPVVARIAKDWPGHSESSWRDVLARELRVAAFLADRGIPVVRGHFSLPCGPHRVADTWMTLWDYAEPAAPAILKPERAVDMVIGLTRALADFPEPLPWLRVWDNVEEAVDSLRAKVHEDPLVSNLLETFDVMQERMHALDAVFPAHGDAHLGNLIHSTAGWRWNDFEDVSLMPPMWDMASLVGNMALLKGLGHPVVKHAFTRVAGTGDMESFRFALTVRVVMATTTNLAMALGGHGDDGDLDFARAQLARIGGLLKRLEVWYT